MAKKKTHEEYVLEIKMKYPTIEVVGKYIDAKTKIPHRCLIHDIVWDSKPNAVLNGYGCFKCGRESATSKQKKLHDEYVTEVKSMYDNIEVVGKYNGNKNRILHRCRIDGYEWSATPNNILRGHGCPKCAEKNQKTSQEYVNEVAEINENIIACEDYINSKTKILHKCKICDYSWHVAPNTILSGHGCPHCSSSNGEKQVKQWLETHNINYIYQKPFEDCRDKNPLPFDFYLPDLNISIEYDGIQHYEPVDFAGKGEIWALQQLKITQRHDAIKNQYCKDNNIQLLRIPYFKNTEEELNNFLFI